jgi:hypothetical protein
VEAKQSADQFRRSIVRRYTSGWTRDRVREGTRRLSQLQDEEPYGIFTWCFRYESLASLKRLIAVATVEPRSVHVEVPVTKGTLIRFFSSITLFPIIYHIFRVLCSHLSVTRKL